MPRDSVSDVDEWSFTQTMEDTLNTNNSLPRRDLIKGGAGTLAAAAGLGLTASIVSAQGTPEAANDASMAGLYGVTRSYVVKDDASIDDLNAIVEGFVAIVSANPGFVSYNVIFDESSRGYITVGIFDNAESAQSSVEEAAEFVTENNLADFFVDPAPLIVQGQIAISASA